MSPIFGTKFSFGAEYASGADDKYEITNYNKDKVVKASFIDNVFDDMVKGENGFIFSLTKNAIG